MRISGLNEFYHKIKSYREYLQLSPGQKQVHDNIEKGQNLGLYIF